LNLINEELKVEDNGSDLIVQIKDENLKNKFYLKKRILKNLAIFLKMNKNFY
jgi:hypothetical protein